MLIVTSRCPLCGQPVEDPGPFVTPPLDAGEVVESVRLALAMRLPHQEGSLSAIAAALDTSARTLQKRLREQGTTFKELTDQVRLELAKEYLAREDTTLVAVAMLLGYSELSAFVRAFARWTGETPGEYRRHLREPRTSQVRELSKGERSRSNRKRRGTR